MPKEEKPKQKSPCKTWDITTKCETVSHPELMEYINKFCKAYAFQKEKGEGGYVHWQGRITFVEKTRKPPFLKDTHFSPTRNENVDKMAYYVMKTETRLEGPWTDKDEKPVFVDWVMESVHTLKPWQYDITQKMSQREARQINLLFDPTGGIGKTTLKKYCEIHKIAVELVFLNDFKDIMRQAYAMMPEPPEERAVIVDLPRSPLKKDQMEALIRLVETIKDGLVIEDRYKFQKKRIQPPNMWIFCNKAPPVELLSPDRWVTWRVIDGVLTGDTPMLNTEGTLEVIFN